MTLDEFRAQYAEHRAGRRDDPPSLDDVTDEADRHTARRWLTLHLATTRGRLPVCSICGFRRASCVACGR